jgi:two-component system, OmpR family, KDP operon response regulator KdpE
MVRGVCCCVTGKGHAMSPQKNTLLVIDSEESTKKILRTVLPDEEFVIEICPVGKKALSLCTSLNPDIILLDLNLEDVNGKDVLRDLRGWSHTPLIILTARSANEDVIEALNLGADDYVIKPFNADIMRARINTNLRKGIVQENGQTELTNGPIRMDLLRHQVFLNNIIVPMTPKEYNLLRCFMTHPGKMLTHKEILYQVWGRAHGEDTQYLRVFIGQIRNKIEADPTSPVMIKTEPGIGYRMEITA